MEQAIINAVISDYSVYLKNEEKSNSTIDKYIRDVNAFIKYLNGKEITKENAVEYKKYIIEKGYAKNSVNSIIASLNGLFGFMNKVDCKLKSIKIQKQAFSSKEKELTKAEYVRLIRTAQKKGNGRLNLLIQTICSTGIRVSELEFITVEAVNKGEAVVWLKGKARRIFIVRELQKKLLRYIAERKIKDGVVFATRTGKPLNRTNIWKEMKSLCEEANVNKSKVFPHNLRHLFARTFYGIEKDIVKLADILGHSSINTTRIYTLTTGDEHRRRMENMKLLI